MEPAVTNATVWRPASDDELTWFRAEGRLARPPRPLDFTFEIYALTWGVTRALESLYFPFYDLRPRLVEGELYLASVPSAFAERDLAAQLQRMQDSGIRFTRNIRATWNRAIKAEVEGYNSDMARFPATELADAEVADALIHLRRTRGNQWFAATRAVFGPVAMLQERDATAFSEEARAVLDEAQELVIAQGAELSYAALERVGARLAQAGCLGNAADIHYLDLQEVRDFLRERRDVRPLVVERKSAQRTSKTESVPETLGPPLASDAPRMHLLREVLALVS
jgi:hypothetical protein